MQLEDKRLLSSPKKGVKELGKLYNNRPEDVKPILLVLRAGGKTNLLFHKVFRKEWTGSRQQLRSWTCEKWDRTERKNQNNRTFLCRPGANTVNV